jgi:hypothetical protein
MSTPSYSLCGSGSPVTRPLPLVTHCSNRSRIFDTAYLRQELAESWGCRPALMHTYLIGASGSGKSTYMLSEAEGAFAFIDKHGQAARQLADTG